MGKVPAAALQVMRATPLDKLRGKKKTSQSVNGKSCDLYVWASLDLLLLECEPQDKEGGSKYQTISEGEHFHFLVIFFFFWLQRHIGTLQ